MSNETTLDDVLALVETWRMRSEGLSFVMDAEEATDRCADDLEALLPAIKAALADARRYRWAVEYGSPDDTKRDDEAWDALCRPSSKEYIDADTDAAQEVGRARPGGTRTGLVRYGRGRLRKPSSRP